MKKQYCISIWMPELGGWQLFVNEPDRSVKKFNTFQEAEEDLKEKTKKPGNSKFDFKIEAVYSKKN